VTRENSKGVFDEYKYGPLTILVDPHTDTVAAVAAPAALWQQGLRNMAMAELRRASAHK